MGQPKTRRVKCRKCDGRGGYRKVGMFGIGVWVQCRECMGRRQTEQIVGDSRVRKR
jgi:DnaJ-class molecular chaperone